MSHDDWVKHVFELKKYFSGINRNRRVGTPILLAKKTKVGDSFLEYGNLTRWRSSGRWAPNKNTIARRTVGS